MSLKTKSILCVLIGLFLTTFSPDTDDKSKPSRWASSYITCTEHVCIENITFPALHITVDSNP